MTEIQEKLERPSDKIVEYCDQLRNQIDIRTETLIEKLNTFRADLMCEIKAFEQKSLKNTTITTEMRQAFDVLLNEAIHKLDEHQKYINQARIEETTVKNLLSEAKINEFNLRNYTKLLDSKLYGANLILFDESFVDGVELDSSVLGKLTYEELKFDKNMVNPRKLTQIKPEKNIECKVVVDRVMDLGNKYVISSENTIKIFETDSESMAEIRLA